MVLPELRIVIKSLSGLSRVYRICILIELDESNKKKGAVAEWSNALDLKSSSFGSTGSNPVGVAEYLSFCQYRFWIYFLYNV